MTSEKKNKQIIILLGAPGSGKGTQGTLLAEKLGYYYLETSKILEETFRSNEYEEYIEIEGKKYYPKKEKEENWEKGNLCSPPFASYLIEKKLRELRAQKKNVLISGSPRTIFEGERLIPLLKELYGEKEIAVILIEISAEDTIYRNSHRRICELMRHPIVYSDETKNLEHCPLDGSKLLRREGLDEPETIKIRIKEYNERTFPLIEYFIKQNLPVAKIDGKQSVANVHQDIWNSLNC